MGSWKGRGNQYTMFVTDLYCNLPTSGMQLPAFPHEAVPGTEPKPQRWEARVLPLCHHGPRILGYSMSHFWIVLFWLSVIVFLFEFMWMDYWQAQNLDLVL